MPIASFDDLLRSAREQGEPQRLLFVFTSAGVPDDATPEQRARFEAGQGGTLTPLMCVDKSAVEWASFDALAEESRRLGQPRGIVFVAAMAAAGPAWTLKRRCSAWSNRSRPAASAASSRSMAGAGRCSLAEPAHKGPPARGLVAGEGLRAC